MHAHQRVLPASTSSPIQIIVRPVMGATPISRSISPARGGRVKGSAPGERASLSVRSTGWSRTTAPLDRTGRASTRCACPRRRAALRPAGRKLPTPPDPSGVDPDGRGRPARPWHPERGRSTRTAGGAKTEWTVYEGHRSWWALRHSAPVDRGMRNAYSAERGFVSLTFKGSASDGAVEPRPSLLAGAALSAAPVQGDVEAAGCAAGIGQQRRGGKASVWDGCTRVTQEEAVLFGGS